MSDFSQIGKCSFCGGMVCTDDGGCGCSGEDAYQEAQKLPECDGGGDSCKDMTYGHCNSDDVCEYKKER